MTWTEQQWKGLFEGAENPTVRLASVLFAWHQIVFWGRYIPYVICDHIAWFRKYRIQHVFFQYSYDFRYILSDNYFLGKE